MRPVRATYEPTREAHARASAGSEPRRAVAIAPRDYGVAWVDGWRAAQAASRIPPGPIQAKAGTNVETTRAAASSPSELPAGLRAGVEALSGLSLQGVRVHLDSPRPRQVNALACTHGKDIYLGPGQQRHLPHEAWHVVQQMQGRVGETGQVGGAAINDNSALEAEADRMGARANAGSLDGPETRPATPPQKTGAGSTSGVMQRRVGFEFEMNWHVKAPGNTIGMHQAIVEGTNWEATPDMSPHPDPNERRYTGWGSFEYVTSAFDESLLGRVRLENTLDEIVTLTDTMAGRLGSLLRTDDSIHLSSEIGGPVRWGAATPQARRGDILVVRHNEAPNASPQMTAGIRRENLPRVFGELGAAPQAGVPNIYGRDATTAGGALSPARTRIATVQARAAQQAARVPNSYMNAAQRSTYEGAITHLALIVALGDIVNVGTNEKYLSPLLSRTNFGDLPGFVRRYATFKSDVLIASGRATVDNWNAVRTQRLFRASPAMGPMTIDAWLNAIRNGNDPLQWGREGDLQRWLPQQVGALGSRSVGHVYEFRGISRRLPVGQWKNWALGQFDHVRNVLNA